MAKKVISKELQLKEAERKIKNGLEQFTMHVGQGLIAIQENQLYKLSGETFAQYCKQQWNLSEQRAYQVITAEKTRFRISKILEVCPVVESHLSEISKAPEDKQAQIAATVLSDCEAEKRKPTAKDYRQAVKPYLESTEPPKNPEEPAGIQAETLFISENDASTSCETNQTVGDIPPDAEIAATVDGKFEHEKVVHAFPGGGQFVEYTHEQPQDQYVDTAEGSLEPEPTLTGFSEGKADLAPWYMWVIKAIRENQADAVGLEAIRSVLDAMNPQNRLVSGRECYTSPFAQFWQAYPPKRKRDKAKALKAFDKAIANGADAGEIIASAAEFAQSPEGMSEFCPGPVPWLNGGRWEDDREAWQTGANNANGKPKADFDSIIDAMEFGETK